MNIPRQKSSLSKFYIKSGVRTTHTRVAKEPKGKGHLSKFYIKSGVRETHGFANKKPKYKMAPLPTREARERAGLRGAGYR